MDPSPPGDTARSTLEGPTALARLDPGEARVAALVAAGRSDAEIAASLQMQARGVEAALATLFPKLGIRTRTELTVLVATEPEPPA